MHAIIPVRSLVMILVCLAFMGVTYSEDDDDAKVPAASTKPSSTDRDADPKKDGAPSGDQVSLTPEVIAHYHITTAPVRRTALTAPVIAAAEVGYDADTVMDIGTIVAGRVQEVRVHVGDVVAAGDILMTIDSQELGQAQNAYLEREGIRAGAEADAKLAQATWTRSEPLVKDQTISSGEGSRREADFHKAQTALLTAEAALAGAENTLRLYGMDDTAVAELQKSHRVSPRVAVRAPAAGAVIARSVTLGEIARPDQEALVVIADLSDVWVTVSVPVARAPDVAVGQPVRILVAGMSQTIPGKVDFVPPGLDPQSHTLPVRISVPWSSGLRPGMFATVAIEVTDPKAAEMTVVPSDAVFSTGMPAWCSCRYRKRRDPSKPVGSSRGRRKEMERRSSQASSRAIRS